jgi:hypothetical protein
MFMKKLVLLLGLLLPASGMAQQYSIDWFKVSGGDSTGTGDVYAVSGTIGQHDTGGSLTGSNYSLTSGFWSLVAVVQWRARRRWVSPVLAMELSSPGRQVRRGLCCTEQRPCRSQWLSELRRHHRR